MIEAKQDVAFTHDKVRKFSVLPEDQRIAIIQSLNQREKARLATLLDEIVVNPFAKYVHDPVAFISDQLGLDETIWGKQKEIAYSLVEYRRTACKASHSNGKTFLFGRLGVWWLVTRPLGEAMLLTTAPTNRQVEHILWKEIRHTHQRAFLKDKGFGEILTKQWKHGSDTIGLGASPSKYDESAFQGFHCFDDKTEILTNEGWKNFQDVRGDEKVLTLNGDVAEWGDITKVWKHRYKGKMNVYDGERINFSITDNHRLLIKATHPEEKKTNQVLCRYCDKPVGAKGIARHEGTHVNNGDIRMRQVVERIGEPVFNWRLEEFNKLPQEFLVRRTNSWAGTNPERMIFETPSGTTGIQRTYDFDFIDFAEFLGWYVSEGSSIRGRISISQKQGKKYEEIFSLLTRMGIKPLRAKHDLKFSHMGLAMWLRENCGNHSPNKKIPTIIKEASTDTIETFLASFGKGDGTSHNHPNARAYITSSVQLRDDLHEVLCKLGRGRKYSLVHEKGSKSVMSTTGREFERRNSTWRIIDPAIPVDSNVLKSKVKKENYDGYVHCVSTPLQTIMVRRNGCSMWSGNSSHLLILVDEAGGIPHLFGNALESITTGANTKLALIGNPPTDEEGSWFQQACDSGLYNVISIPATSTPNFTGEPTGKCKTCSPETPEHSINSHLVDKKWVRDVIRTFGKDSNFVRARVYAKFPTSSSSKVLPSDWLEQACLNENPMAGNSLELGVDVAADGGDEFVIAVRDGWTGKIVHRSSGADNNNTIILGQTVLKWILACEKVHRTRENNAKIRVKIDEIGIGRGLTDWLKLELTKGRHSAEIIGINVAETAKDSQRFANKRAEMWWNMRDLIQPDSTGAQKVRLLLHRGERDDGTKIVDFEVLSQFAAPTYFSRSTGAIAIESKVDMKKRLGRSPDSAEAMLLAFYNPSVSLASINTDNSDLNINPITDFSYTTDASAFDFGMGNTPIGGGLYE